MPAAVRPTWQARLGDWLRGREPHATASSAATLAGRIYILPSRLGLAFAVTLFVTLLGSLNYQNNLGLLFTFLMVAIALVSMHHCWFNLLGLRLVALGGPPVFLDQRAVFHITLTEGRGSPRGEMCLHQGGCAALAATGQARLRLTLPTLRRGELALGAVTLETRHPLGLFRAWTRVPLAATVLVYPRPAPRATHPGLREARDPAAKGRQGHGADDFLGPRRYRPGDSPRHLDWKALARERGLMVKQFGGDQGSRLSLDWHLLSGDTETRLSELARQVLDADTAQAIYGLRLPHLALEPGSGDSHKHRCLEALARFGEAQGAG